MPPEHQKYVQWNGERFIRWAAKNRKQHGSRGKGDPEQLQSGAAGIFVIGLIRQTSLLSDEMIVWEIIGNFAAFGLWQIGYTHCERNEGCDELLTAHIAKYARLNFIEK